MNWERGILQVSTSAGVPAGLLQTTNTDRTVWGKMFTLLLAAVVLTDVKCLLVAGKHFSLLTYQTTTTWTCCCKQIEVYWSFGRADPGWTLSMGSSEWGSAHTPHWAALKNAGMTEGGVEVGGGLSRRRPTLEVRGGWMSPRLRRTAWDREMWWLLPPLDPYFNNHAYFHTCKGWWPSKHIWINALTIIQGHHIWQGTVIRHAQICVQRGNVVKIFIKPTQYTQESSE